MEGFEGFGPGEGNLRQLGGGPASKRERTSEKERGNVGKEIRMIIRRFGRKCESVGEAASYLETSSSRVSYPQSKPQAKAKEKQHRSTRTT